MERMLPGEHHHLVRVLAGACGKGQPTRDVVMTREHAIRCPAMMEELEIPTSVRHYLHTFPDRLREDLIRTGDEKENYVCNLDVGDPETPLVAQGLLTESWDGREASEPREYTWKDYGDTPFVRRMRTTVVPILA